MASTLLLIGTKRGLFRAHTRDRHAWSLSPPSLEGREVMYAFRDGRTGVSWAATRHRIWGSHLHRSDDGGETWQTLESAPAHTDGRGLAAIWRLAPGPDDEPETLYAGVEPAGLFVTRDAGRTWAGLSGLNDHVTRPTWQAMGGGLALTDVCGQEGPTLYAAISAGGVYASVDGGRTWAPRNRGVRACFQPDEFPESGQCVHKLIAHPARSGRLFQQNHCGTYRSDDAGETWVDITPGLPSDYGYALAVHPRDPDTAWVIPEASSHLRTVVDGALRVFETRNAGGSWEARTRGLPQRDAYVTVLREGLATDQGEPVGLYLGTSGGHVFASSDGGGTWAMIAGFLPRILSMGAWTL